MSIKRLLPREPSWHRLGGIVAGQTGRLEGVRSALADVRFGSKADSCTATKVAVYHFVGAHKE